MSATVRVLEEDIFQLCERPLDKHTALEKQRLYSRVGQFLMGSFDGHWWCRYPTLMTFMVRILELHPGPESVRMFYDKMAHQLGLCSKCADIYHSAMPSVRAELENEFTPASVKDFFHKISQLDADRMHSIFAIKTGPYSVSPSTIQFTTSFYEVLSHRRLWSDFRIIRVISKWLAATAEPLKDAAIDKDLILSSCPGILQWLVSPDPGIRAWATSLVGKFGIVDMNAETADGRKWMKVLDEWMYILESGSFNTSLLSLDLPSTEELPVVRHQYLDATNCVKTPTNQILWAALDTIMQRMNENSLEALLESFDNLPDLVFNYLNDAEPATTSQQITFVICKCYGSLLKCLGHRYWNHTVHSPKVVLDLIIQHCQLPSWRVFVTKQLIELLPPLVASMRPPSNSTSEANKAKVVSYFEARKRVLLLLLHQEQRPAHFNNDQVLCVATSKAVSTLVCDCYEPRLASSSSASPVGEATRRDDGALPETSLVDLSVIESSFWWPIGPSFEDVELLWMNHLFLLLVNPENVASLVDHVAMTCTTVLLKHLSLAREVVYTTISAADSATPLSTIMPKKPIVTRLLERLCAWSVIATIPIAVHGALFESIGGMAELMNVIEAQQQPPTAIVEFKSTLKRYETLVSGSYLDRISEEVHVKGLMNPLRFPVVAQHLTLCLLSPNPQVDLRIKRLLTQAGANKATPDRTPSPLESLLVVVHRNTEAYLRGVLNLLQAWRLHDFALRVILPTVKKVIFTWTKVFEMLVNDIKKALEASGESLSKQSQSDSTVVNLQKVPLLMGDFLVRLLTELYGSTRSMVVEEPVLIQCLDFGNSFWKFFTREDKPVASSKRFEGMVAPLVRCVEDGGGQSEKRRAAELLMTLLETFVDAQTRINDASIAKLETIKASSIESKKSTDFSRMAGKLRQVSKASRFFAPRPITTTSKRKQQRHGVVDLTSGERKATSPNGKLDQSLVDGRGTSRPMSGKAAAREQARLAAARSAASMIFETSTKKAHSFYDEDDFVAGKAGGSAKPTSGSVDTKAKGFSISSVIKGMEQVHPGSRNVRDSGRVSHEAAKKSVKQNEEDDEDEEEDDTTNLAPLFFKIKNTQKAIPSCSLLPFYRHLLQVSIPALLTKEFENERSDRELTAPSLTFGKSAEYVNAFLPLLLEECHNEVQESLRRCYFSSGKNNGHLLRYETEKPREGMRCLSFSVVESVATAPFGQGQRPGDRFARREKLFRNADVVLVRAVGNKQHAGIDFLGVVLISESERGKRRQGGGPRGQAGAGAASNGADVPKDDDELVKILFLNDGELESVTSDVPTFKMEAVTASAIADTEWRVTTLSNLVTATREYIALRSVDMLPEHLRTTILTPNMYETTQTELLKMTMVLDDLRVQKHGRDDADRKLLKLLKRLDRMDVSLTDLRSTSIGKPVNKLRKHEKQEIKSLASSLVEKWTALMNKKDALDVAPRYVSSDLWDAIKVQYNQSQLQSIHSVLNNYSAGISLLQGPPGTGKTKTIMGLLSAFLALKMPPAMTLLRQSTKSSATTGTEKPSDGSRPGPGDSGFSNFDLVRELATKQTGPVSTPTFSLSGTPASSRLLRHTDVDVSARKPTAIQALKGGSVRSRLENKMSSNRPASADVLRRTLLGPSVMSVRSRNASAKSANVLLCAPSNGAVDELVLRIVTDGLMDSAGKVQKVRAPSVHPDSAADWLSIVRLGNPGEDAPDIVKAVCLPHIIKQELEIHPKTIELRELQERQRTLRSSIKAFHDKKNEDKEAGVVATPGPRPKGRSSIAKTHTEMAEVSGKVRRLRDEVSTLESKMTAAILARASIIACTLSKAGSGTFNGLQRGFDALIIDEAAQAVELSTLVPIRERVARVVLVGDPKQLPATVKSVVAANARFDRSLFERIADSGVAPSMLRVQYRMHPFLREFPSKRFYGGMLTDGASVMERVQRVCGDVYKHPYFQPFMLYDLVDTREDTFNGSKFNKSEAAFCVDLCSSLFEICSDLRSKKWSVGFVSPYKEQVRVLRQELTRCRTIPSTVSIEVNTVDGFQGREKDVIIFSCVRASDRGGIGFLKDIRRLNVAITRARFCLFVVGSARTLRRDETWNALVHSAQERKLVIRAKASGGFAGVKQDLDRDGGSLMAHYEEMHGKLLAKKLPAALPSPRQESPQNDDSVKRTKTEEHPVKTDTGNSGTNSTSEAQSLKREVKTKPRSTGSGFADGGTREHEARSDGSVPEKKVKSEAGSRHGSGGGTESDRHSPVNHDKREDRSRSSVHSSSSRNSAPRDRSRSRGCDDRHRDHRNKDDHDRRVHPPHSSTASSSSVPHVMKRSPPPHERDVGPNKSARHTHDQSRRRSRSRSRDRSSVSSRADRSSQNPSRDSRSGSDAARRPSRDPDPTTASSGGTAREHERSADQKHRDRQDRLRALRDVSDPRALSGARQSQGASRIVQLVRAGSGSRDGPPPSSTTNSRPSSGASGNSRSLLSSILGSSTQLASATSRVDKANARRD